MIQNDHQLQISLTQADKLETSLREAKLRGKDKDIDPTIWQAYLDGIESMAGSVRTEIALYMQSIGNA